MNIVSFASDTLLSYSLNEAYFRFEKATFSLPMSIHRNGTPTEDQDRLLKTLSLLRERGMPLCAKVEFTGPRIFIHGFDAWTENQKEMIEQIIRSNWPQLLLTRRTV